MTEPELLAAVDAAFAITGHGLESWPDPHSGKSPLEAEYSRLTDPGKWRIVGARADAWLTAATDLGLATVEQRTAVQWAEAPGTMISRSDRAVPHAAGAVPLVVAYSKLGNIDDAGITLGIGDPAVPVGWFPHCGCDACDTGSQDTLDDLDTRILSIMAGTSGLLSSSDITGKSWLDNI